MSGVGQAPGFPAERVLMSALLARPVSYYDLGNRLREDMFADPGCRLLYRAFGGLAAEGRPIDLATLEHEMQRLDGPLFKQLNGLLFLGDLLQQVGSDMHLLEYARLMREDWLLREGVACLQRAALGGMQPDTQPEQWLTGVRGEVDGLLSDAGQQLRQRPVGEVALEVLERSYRNQQLRAEGKFVQIGTGFDELDALTGGLYAGELLVLSGRPSMGKTAVALHMALEAARNGWHTLFFSIEMSEEEVTERLLAKLSGVGADKIRFKGTLPVERELLQKAADELAGLPLTILYSGALTIDEIRAVVMARKARGEADLLFIDYLNLMHMPTAGKGRNETTDLAMGEVVRKVKLIANEARVPAVLLAQMNRDADKRQPLFLPILSDLRNSGAIEQVADQVVFVYRPERYGITRDATTKEDLRGVGNLLVAKNRNGATGRARFRYNAPMTAFYSYERLLL